MKWRAARVPCVIAMAVLICWSAAPAQAGDVGKVRFVKEAKASFDAFTDNPSAGQAAWMREHFWRQKTYAPYFDARTSWYPNAWTYKDLYAMYADDDTITPKHPEWILRDGAGRKLYIPYGCSGGSCPQYAGDVGNPAFRKQWIAAALDTLRPRLQGPVRRRRQHGAARRRRPGPGGRADRPAHRQADDARRLAPLRGRVRRGDHRRRQGAEPAGRGRPQRDLVLRPRRPERAPRSCSPPTTSTSSAASSTRACRAAAASGR